MAPLQKDDCQVSVAWPGVLVTWLTKSVSNCSVSSLLNVVLKYRVPLRILARISYTILCASALSERLLGKDFLRHFSHFLLEVMPELCVPVPHFLTRILQEPVNYFRGSPIRIGSMSCKYPNNYRKVRERIYLGEVCLWWQIRSLEWGVHKTLATGGVEQVERSDPQFWLSSQLCWWKRCCEGRRQVYGKN